MPFTPKQRRLFHYKVAHPDPTLDHETARKLAREADELARRGAEKKPKKAADKGFIDLSKVW